MYQGSPTALSRYGTVQVTTCSPGQLLVLLYDGLFQFLGEAQALLLAGERARATERLGRSHQILEQLLVGVDPIPAPELGEHLQALYHFCMRRVLDARIHQDPAPIAEVLKVLSPLRAAWKEVVSRQNVPLRATVTG
ncbi:MAG: flagellar export chaperone FliS [Deltaproteobacteria bacterium]|nr:flagellar export chaperone FliS [Deltaproteobacteria bacterium]